MGKKYIVYYKAHAQLNEIWLICSILIFFLPVLDADL